MNARYAIASVALLLAAFATPAVFAQPPAGSTGECKDGTYTTAKSKRGACAGHGGVKSWFEAKKPASKPATKPAKETSKASATTKASKTKTSATKAATAAEAPAGSTGECKDGTYTSAQSKRGACAGHGGVKTWFEQKEPAKKQARESSRESPRAPAAMESSKPEAATAAEAPAKAAPRAAPAPASKASETTSRAPAAPAAGSGPGMVWVNTPTKVYHCSGDRWYGKTQHGEYMSEAEAKAKGYRPSYDKPCS